MKTVALLGNPNVGKTTLFNLLTGSNQKVGNWSGVTIDKKEDFLMISKLWTCLVYTLWILILTKKLYLRTFY